MKNKLFGITVVVAVIAVLAGCAGMQLESLDTIEGPRQMRQGQDMDPASITVYGVYKDGSRKTVSINASNITFDRNAVGPQTVTVRVSGQAGSFQTEVMAFVSLTISSPPNTLIYKQGQAVSSWSGLALQGEWDQMGRQSIAPASTQITGYSSDRVGSQTITITYLGKTASFDVSVVPMTSIRVAQPPSKVDYAQGEALNLAGLQVVGVWEGLPEEPLSVAANEVTGYNANTPGVQRLTITKSGITTTLNVEVLRLANISIEQPPNKTEYAVGERLDLTGIIITGNYTGTTASKTMSQAIPIDQMTASGFNSGAVARNQRITVTVGQQSANFFVNIVEAVPPVAGTWSYTRTSGEFTMTLIFVFNSNGTGSLTVAGGAPNSITWTASGNTLSYSFTDDGRTVTGTYSISGNTLTFILQEDTLTMTRQ